MPRRQTTWALLVALLAAVAFGVVVRPALATRTAVRIMPLGDSITAGTGCWRAMLWQRLETTGYTDIDFVGSVSDGGGCNPGYSYDTHHEGHGGFSATGIADNNQLPPWLDAAKPDIVLMHLGTNDMWGGYIPLERKLAAFTKLVGQMRANNPRMRILVARIIPMGPSSCSTCAADVVALDTALPAWAAGLSTAQSPIVLVDQWTGFDATRDTIDGVHPNNAGYQKMADRWYPALARVLDGMSGSPSTGPTTTAPPTTAPATTAPATTAPTTSPATSPATSPTTSPTTRSGTGTSAPVTSRPGITTPHPATTCSASYRVIARWAGGFLAQITVRNNSAATSAAWTVDLRFADGQRVVQAWSSTLRQSGAAVTARNLGYNGTLAAGQSTSFGFVATSNQRNTVPALTCTLG